MKKEEQPQPSEKKRAKDEQELHIHIERWQDLVDILDDKKKIYRLAAVVVIIGLALFSGVTFIILQLKKSFTYSDITTNALGVTTLRDEQKEVSYFLFNTATLWANSGIEVEEGDVISVHSSGSAHTAIHHLSDAGEKNYRMDEDYFDADGERFNSISPRNRARRKYRIVPYLPNNALIMQVYSGNGRPPLNAKDGDNKAQKNIYYISQHRENIIIHESGTLYFAINDIVLDSATIFSMKEDNYRYMLDTLQNDSDSVLMSNHALIEKIYCKDINTKHWRDSVEKTTREQELKCTKFSHKNTPQRVDDTPKALKKEDAVLTDEEAKIFRKCMKQSIYQFGPYYNEDRKNPSKSGVDSLTFRTEMDYYLEHKYPTAWFDDNVGSFLIVIERNYRK